jgi:hypothetical protein
LKDTKPIQTNLDWAKEVLHEFKHKVELKETRGNLMNLLNLAKDSIEPITSFKLDLSPPHGS